MRHLFIIQCHRHAQAVALGNLLTDIAPIENGVPKWEVFYAYDSRSNESELFERYQNAKGFSIGYETIDQGMFHLLLWRYIYESEYYKEFNFFHLISESDLPFKGIFRVDEILDGYDMYGYINKNNDLHKAIAWYGLSQSAVSWIAKCNIDIAERFPRIWYKHNQGGYTGGIDEYIIASMLEYTKSICFRMREECLRLVMYQESGRDATLATDGTPIDWYGHKSNSRTSPIILDNTPATNYAFENWDVLFGRKFQFDSKSYAHFVKLIRDAKV